LFLRQRNKRPRTILQQPTWCRMVHGGNSDEQDCCSRRRQKPNHASGDGDNSDARGCGCASTRASTERPASCSAGYATDCSSASGVVFHSWALTIVTWLLCPGLST